MRLFNNAVLRGIFEPQREKVIGRWRKFENEKPNDL
jgi:hypothetical protein